MESNNAVRSAYGPQLGRRLQLSYAEQNLVGLSGNCMAEPPDHDRL